MDECLSLGSKIAEYRFGSLFVIYYDSGWVKRPNRIEKGEWSVGADKYFLRQGWDRVYMRPISVEDVQKWACSELNRVNEFILSKKPSKISEVVNHIAEKIKLLSDNDL